VPDIVTMAKGIGNGCPLAAVVTRPEIAQALTQRIHFNTFGGDPVATAQGKAVLEVIDEEGLQARAAARGARFLAGLRRLQDRYDLIGDIRGHGLLLGIDLVEDRRTKAPAREATLRIHESARDHGLLLGKGGLRANVLRLTPPLCLSDEDVDFALEVLDLSLRAA
jgi:alanine-glyoxylate transaminase / (R)-3-amino-2-methylpropionate-pyruvate transaminase